MLHIFSESARRNAGITVARLAGRIFMGYSCGEHRAACIFEVLAVFILAGKSGADTIIWPRVPVRK